MAEAARNDEAILRAAREVFIKDPGAPMSAVADRAGVGIGGLYRRYQGKEDLLKKLCGDGLRHFVALAEGARDSVRNGADPWEAFTTFVSGVVDSDVHALTVRLAGSFPPAEDLRALAVRSGTVVGELVRDVHQAGALREDVTAADLPMLFAQLSAVSVRDGARTAQLRGRYLTLQLDGLRRTESRTALGADGPTASELRERWDGSR
ncbi:MAG: TetR/AcrR family transcriptional regulator [Streptosporangiaceae bacterium]